MRTVSSVACSQRHLASVTGLPLADFTLIAIAEFLRVICFLCGRAEDYRGELLSCVGGWGILMLFHVSNIVSPEIASLNFGPSIK